MLAPARLYSNENLFLIQISNFLIFNPNLILKRPMCIYTIELRLDCTVSCKYHFIPESGSLAQGSDRKCYACCKEIQVEIVAQP